MSFMRQLMDFEKAELGSQSMISDDLATCPFCRRMSVFSRELACGHRCCWRCLEEKQRASSDPIVCSQCAAVQHATSMGRSLSLLDMASM